MYLTFRKRADDPGKYSMENGQSVQLKTQKFLVLQLPLGIRYNDIT